MDFHNNHPLNNITRNNPYSMLEALIPFVDYPMKLPLALFIKYHELRLIVEAFQSIDSLSQYGLHNTSSNPMDMLASFTGISPEILKTMMSLNENQNIQYTNNTTGGTDNTINNYNTTINDTSNTINTNTADKTYNFDEESFDEKIKNIFAEYDLLQASEYSDLSSDDRHTETNTIQNNENNSSVINETSTEPEYYI